MEFGGLPPEGPMMPPQNGMVDASMMPQQNGLVEGDRSEMVPQPNNVEAYRYEQQGPAIDAEFTEIHTVMADGGDRHVFVPEARFLTYLLSCGENMVKRLQYCFQVFCVIDGV